MDHDLGKYLDAILNEVTQIRVLLAEEAALAAEEDQHESPADGGGATTPASPTVRRKEGA